MVGHEASTLPRLFLIADGFASGRQGQAAELVRERVKTLVRGGVRAVQLRDHAAPPDVFLQTATAFAHHLYDLSEDLVLIANTHLELASLLECGGHVGIRGPGIDEARQQLGHRWLGVSVHSATEARLAPQAGADYLFVSPIFPTRSHPETPGMGFGGLRWACEASAPTPVYAMGGVTPGRTRACLQAGAYGVAVLSDLLDAPAPLERLHDYQTVLAI